MSDLINAPRLSRALELIRDRRLRPVCSVSGVYVGPWPPTEWPGWGPYFSAGACPRLSRVVREYAKEWLDFHLGPNWRERRLSGAVLATDLHLDPEGVETKWLLTLESRSSQQSLEKGTKLKYAGERGDADDGWWAITWKVADGPEKGLRIEGNTPGGHRGGVRLELADCLIWPADVSSDVDVDAFLSEMRRVIIDTLGAKVKEATLFSYRPMDNGAKSPAAG